MRYVPDQIIQDLIIKRLLTVGNLSGVLKASSGVVSGSATTSDLPEGTNLYYTAARFNTAFAAKTTTDLAEGTNLYYTDIRARATHSAGTGISYSSTTGVITNTGAITVSNSDGTLTISPTSGAVVASLALGNANTWTAQQTFNTAAAKFGVGIITPKIYPAADSTTAIQILKSDGTTNILTVDTTNSRIGIGTATPRDSFEVRTGQQYFSNANVAHGFTAYVPTDVYGRIGIVSAANGGFYFSGYSATNTTPGVIIQGGVNGDPTTDISEAFFFQGYKRSGTGGIAIGSTGRVLAIYNFVTPLFTVLGNGKVGIGQQAPSAFLHVMGTTEQLRIGYDASNYYTTTVSSTGGVTFDANGTGAAFTFSDTVTAAQVIHTNNAIAAVANAATVPITSRINTVTNNSAATLTITMTTTGAVAGQLSMVRILDFSAAAQTIAWVNTENSTASVPLTSNGSTTLPLTVTLQYNALTSKWRCISTA